MDDDLIDSDLEGGEPAPDTLHIRFRELFRQLEVAGPEASPATVLDFLVHRHGRRAAGGRVDGRLTDLGLLTPLCPSCARAVTSVTLTYCPLSFPLHPSRPLLAFVRSLLMWLFVCSVIERRHFTAANHETSSVPTKAVSLLLPFPATFHVRKH